MNYSQKIFSGLWSATLLTYLVGAAVSCWAKEPELFEVTALRIRGQVWLETQRRERVIIKEGTKFKQCATVITGTNSWVDLVFGNPDRSPIAQATERRSGTHPLSVVRLFPGSNFEVRRFSNEPSEANETKRALLELHAGTLTSRMTALTRASTFDYLVPQGVIGVMPDTAVLKIESNKAVSLLKGTIVYSATMFGGIRTQEVIAPKQFDFETEQQSPLRQIACPEYPPIYFEAPSSASPFRGHGMGGALRVF